MQAVATHFIEDTPSVLTGSEDSQAALKVAIWRDANWY
jgi:hypothetical protein